MWRWNFSGYSYHPVIYIAYIALDFAFLWGSLVWIVRLGLYIRDAVLGLVSCLNFISTLNEFRTPYRVFLVALSVISEWVESKRLLCVYVVLWCYKTDFLLFLASCILETYMLLIFYFRLKILASFFGSEMD